MDDTNTALALKLLESIKPQEDSLYLFCKLDSLPFSSSFLYIAAKFANVHLDLPESDEFRTPIDGGSVHLFDCNTLRRTHFRFLQQKVELIPSSLKSSGSGASEALGERSLLDEALDVWGGAATIIILPSNNSNLLGLVRHARNCGARIFPIESQYDISFTNLPNPIVNAAASPRVSLAAALHYCNNEARPGSPTNKDFIKAGVSENPLNLSLFSEAFLEQICEQYGDEFGGSSEETLESMVSSSSVVRRVVTQKICESLRTYSGSVTELYSQIEEVISRWESAKTLEDNSLRVWLLNTLNDEHPFLLYDYLLERVNARGDSCPAHVTVFATNPVRHIRRPRIDLAHIGTEQRTKDPNWSTKTPSLNWYNRRYTTNVILAKHTPGADPNYPRLDCIVTNGLLLALSKEKSLAFLEGMKKCLNPGGLIVTTAAEREKLGLKEPTLEGLERIKTLKFGKVDAAKFYRIHRAKDQDSPLWT